MKPKCGAKTRSGRPCRNAAGWKTRHPGVGRCKLHGGCNESNNLKHGLYSKHLKESEREIFDMALQSDQIKKLREEIALVRTRLVLVLGSKAFKVEEIKTEAIVAIVDKIGKLVERAVRIEDGIKVVKTHELQVKIANLFIQILTEEFAGDELRAKKIVGKVIVALERMEEAERG